MSEKLKTRICPGCKTIFPYQEELNHYSESGIARYGVATPECAATFFEILTLEGERYGYPPAHRLIIDAYALQHPPYKEVQQLLGISPRLIDASIQSISIHLLALYCAIEKKMPLETIAAEMNQILTQSNKHKVTFDLLSPPSGIGVLKAIDVHALMSKKLLTLEEYTQLAWDWAHTVWRAWAHEHDTICTLYEKYR